MWYTLKVYIAFTLSFVYGIIGYESGLIRLKNWIEE